MEQRTSRWRERLTPHIILPFNKVERICPVCKKNDEALESLRRRYPKEVQNDLSHFLDFSHLVEDSTYKTIRCCNCMAYFLEETNQVIDDPIRELKTRKDLVPVEVLETLYSLPSDLFRVISNECRLGNRVCGVVSEPQNGRIALYLDGSFRDGHCTSSWTEQWSRFVNGIDVSIYICDAAKTAIAAQRATAEQYAAVNGCPGATQP